jgi:hypothetical protein
LLRHRDVQPIGVPRRLDVGRRRAFSEHLLDRIARHQVNQQKNNGHDQPQHGQCVQCADE